MSSPGHKNIFESKLNENDENGSNPPDHCICPISLVLMSDPVSVTYTCRNGETFSQTYDKKSIVQWLGEEPLGSKNKTDPKTHMQLDEPIRLITQRELKEECLRYKKKIDAENQEILAQKKLKDELRKKKQAEIDGERRIIAKEQKDGLIRFPKKLFVCPFSKMILEDPVTFPNGKTASRAFLPKQDTFNFPDDALNDPPTVKNTGEKNRILDNILKNLVIDEKNDYVKVSINLLKENDEKYINASNNNILHRLVVDAEDIEKQLVPNQEPSAPENNNPDRGDAKSIDAQNPSDPAHKFADVVKPNYGSLQENDDVVRDQIDEPGQDGDILLPPQQDLAAPLLPANGAAHVGINVEQKYLPYCSGTMAGISVTTWLTAVIGIPYILNGTIPGWFHCCDPSYTPAPLEWIFSKTNSPRENTLSDDPDFTFQLHNPNPDEMVVTSVQFNTNAYVKSLWTPGGAKPLFPQDAKLDQTFDETEQLWTITITASKEHPIHIPGNGDAAVNAAVSSTIGPLPTTMPPTTAWAGKEKIAIQGLNNDSDPTPGITLDAIIEPDSFLIGRSGHYFDIASLGKGLNRLSYSFDVSETGDIVSSDAYLDDRQLYKVNIITQQRPNVVNSALKFGESTPGFSTNTWAKLASNETSTANFASNFEGALRETRSVSGIVDWRWGGIDKAPRVDDYVNLIQMIKAHDADVEITVPGTDHAVKEFSPALSQLTNYLSKVWILPRGSSNETASFAAPLSAYKNVRMILNNLGFTNDQIGIQIPTKCRAFYVTSMGPNHGYGQPIDNTESPPKNIDYACAYSGGANCRDDTELPKGFTCIDQTVFEPQEGSGWCFSDENLVFSCPTPGLIKNIVREGVSVSIADATEDLAPKNPQSMTQVISRARQSQAPTITAHKNSGNSTAPVTQNLENSNSLKQDVTPEKIELPQDLQTQLLAAATRGALNAVVIQGILDSFLKNRNYSEQKKLFIQQGLQALLILYQLGPGLMNAAKAIVSPVIIRILIGMGCQPEIANNITMGATTAIGICSSPATTLPLFAVSTIASAMAKGAIDARVGKDLMQVLTLIPNYFVDSRPMQYVANKMDAVYQSAANSRAVTAVSNTVNKIATSVSECQVGKIAKETKDYVATSRPFKLATHCAFFVADQLNKTHKKIAEGTASAINGAERVARWSCGSKPPVLPQVVQTKQRKFFLPSIMPIIIKKVAVKAVPFIPRRVI